MIGRLDLTFHTLFMFQLNFQCGSLTPTHLSYCLYSPRNQIFHHQNSIREVTDHRLMLWSLSTRSVLDSSSEGIRLQHLLILNFFNILRNKTGFLNFRIVSVESVLTKNLEITNLSTQRLLPRLINWYIPCENWELAHKLHYLLQIVLGIFGLTEVSLLGVQFEARR